MDVQLVYGTTEGQTRKVAELTAAHVRRRTMSSCLTNAALMSDLYLETFHAFVAAGT